MSVVYHESALDSSCRQRLENDFKLVRSIVFRVVERMGFRIRGERFRDHNTICVDVMGEVCRCLMSVRERYPNREWVESYRHAARIGFQRVWRKKTRNGESPMGDNCFAVLSPDSGWDVSALLAEIETRGGVRKSDVQALGMAYSFGWDDSRCRNELGWGDVQLRDVKKALEWHVKRWLAKHLPDPT